MLFHLKALLELANLATDHRSRVWIRYALDGVVAELSAHLPVFSVPTVGLRGEFGVDLRKPSDLILIVNRAREVECLIFQTFVMPPGPGKAIPSNILELMSPEAGYADLRSRPCFWYCGGNDKESFHCLPIRPPQSRSFGPPNLESQSGKSSEEFMIRCVWFVE